MKLPKFILVIVLFAILGLYYYESRILLKQTPNAWTDERVADCAVVLTGGTGRVKEGFALLARGSIKKLIVSGVYRGSNLRDIFPQWPFYGGLDEKDVILEKRSGTTYGNAQQSLPLVEALHCRDVLLVTSHLHMYRALKSFKTVYPEDFPIYPHAIAGGRLKPSFYDLTLEATKSLFYSIWAY